MGKQKLLKPVQKLKYCIEKTYEVELQSSDSDLDTNHQEDICLQENNQKIPFLYRMCYNFNPNPPSPRKEK